jgi:hypothetical protein
VRKQQGVLPLKFFGFAHSRIIPSPPSFVTLNFLRALSRQLKWARKPLAQRETLPGLAVVEIPPPIPKAPLNMLVPNLTFLRGQPFPTEGDLNEYLSSL